MGCGHSKEAPAVLGNNNHHHASSKEEPMTVAEIESRIECIQHTQSVTFGGIRIRYAYLSQRGFYPDGTSYLIPFYWSYCDSRMTFTNAQRLVSDSIVHDRSEQGQPRCVFHRFELWESVDRCISRSLRWTRPGRR